MLTYDPSTFLWLFLRIIPKNMLKNFQILGLNFLPSVEITGGSRCCDRLYQSTITNYYSLSG